MMRRFLMVFLAVFFWVVSGAGHARTCPEYPASVGLNDLAVMLGPEKHVRIYSQESPDGFAADVEARFFEMGGNATLSLDFAVLPDETGMLPPGATSWDGRFLLLTTENGTIRDSVEGFVVSGINPVYRCFRLDPCPDDTCWNPEVNVFLEEEAGNGESCTGDPLLRDQLEQCQADLASLSSQLNQCQNDLSVLQGQCSGGGGLVELSQCQDQLEQCQNELSQCASSGSASSGNESGNGIEELAQCYDRLNQCTADLTRAQADLEDLQAEIQELREQLSGSEETSSGSSCPNYQAGYREGFEAGFQAALVSFGYSFGNPGGAFGAGFGFGYDQCARYDGYNLTVPCLRWGARTYQATFHQVNGDPVTLVLDWAEERR